MRQTIGMEKYNPKTSASNRTKESKQTRREWLFHLPIPPMHSGHYFAFLFGRIKFHIFSPFDMSFANENSILNVKIFK